MILKSSVPHKIGLIFVTMILAACSSPQAMPTFVLPTGTAAPAFTATVTTTATATITPTKIKLPTATGTATLVPTSTLLPKIMLTPVEVSIANCGSTNIQPGQRVLMESYLAVQAGRYNLNDPSYPITLITDLDDRIGVVGWIPAGNKSNSMYFDNGKPIIKDNEGQIIPWIRRGGQEVYITSRIVRVIGTFRYKFNNLYCHINIEKIY